MIRRRLKIAVVTTSRADYGLLYWLLKAIDADPSLHLRLLVCGSHLSRDFGGSVRQIRSDGFLIAREIDTLPRREDALGMAGAVSRGTLRFAAAFSELSADLLVVLGDRYELLAATSAAVVARLPIAHIHGGESTEGVLDEQVRHAVTKLSHIHFTAAEPYRRRVIQMGEDPRRVFNVGALGLESIRRLAPVPRRVLERRLRFDLRTPFVVAAFHPDSLGAPGGRGNLEALLAAVSALRLRAVFTYANADAGGREMNRRILGFAEGKSSVKAVPNLPQAEFLSLLRLSQAVVGNSSSGIIEAPSLKVPTVNVGDRQKGRLRSPSVIDCPPARVPILRAIRRAFSAEFRRRCTGENVYGAGDSSRRILAILKKAPPSRILLSKSFHDIGAAGGR